MQDKHKIILLRSIFVLSLIGILPMLGGVGTGLGLWEPMTGFRMTRQYTTLPSSSALAAIFMIMKYFIKDMKPAVITYLVVLMFGGAGYFLGINQEPTDWSGIRGIHDVNTDTENPPEFIALLDAPGRRNSFDYPPETAMRQKAKFPWVAPLISELSPEDAYGRAIDVAKQMNWDVVGEKPGMGRFEATAYTKWFNFHDDVVVRITAAGSGSRIDLRSLSRVGGTDHGLGAIRIMKFQKNFSGQ